MEAAIDVYRITDKLDGATLSALETRLEARGRHPRFTTMMNEYLGAMDIESAQRVLDLGCGTGVAARAIARRPRFAGRVIGIDRSPRLTATAARLAREEGCDSKVEFLAGDSHTLQLGDEQFDAVVAHTLLSHVEDPAVVINEIVRVAKRGARIGIFDGDYASLTFSSDDSARAKASDETIIGALVTNPRVMRDMPLLLRRAGVKLIASFAYVVADMGRAEFWEPAIKSFVMLLPKSGSMSDAQAADWAAAMLRRSDEGTFFGASNFYSYVALKP